MVWAGHFGIYERLQTAVRILMEGKGKLRERLDHATFALATLLPRDFPKEYREIFERIMNKRRSVRKDYGSTSCMFHFENLTPTQRKELIADIKFLFERCLIEMDKEEAEIIRTPDLPVKKPKRKKKPKN